MPDVKMPQLGESVTEGTLGPWLKKVGDPVAKYEPLVEVVTDKVNAEIPCDFDGVLSEILVNEGETVKVGTVICRVAVAGEETSSAPAATTPADVKPAASASAREEHVPSSVAASGTSSDTRKRGRFSPAVLRLAEEHDIDLNDISGTGEGGRITRKDVLAFVEQGGLSSSQAAAPQVLDAAPVASERRVEPVAAPNVPVRDSAVSASVGDDVEVIEPTAIRKTIARRMVESKHTAPHAWTMVESDVTKLVQFRQKVKGDFKRKEGIDLTYLPFFIKAVVEALKQYPILNSSWVDDKIHLKKRINISIAVATDNALVVPVIHDADRLSVAGLAHAINELAAKARSGRLSIQDVQGGTFTVNNTGAFGSILSQPIINAPQAAILSVESIVKRPVVIDEAIAIRSMVNLSLSLDHRVLDGWVTGLFLKAVRERLEAFDQSTVLF